jgi:hypothetical protein
MQIHRSLKPSTEKWRVIPEKVLCWEERQTVYDILEQCGVEARARDSKAHKKERGKNVCADNDVRTGI